MPVRCAISYDPCRCGREVADLSRQPVSGKCTLMHHVRSLVDDLIMKRRHVSERVGLSYEPLSVIGSVQDLKMLIHLRVVLSE